MDKLRNILRRRDESVADFARAIGVHVRTGYKYVDGDHIPNREVMSRIVKWSGGEIQPNDFYQFAPPQTEGRAAE